MWINALKKAAAAKGLTPKELIDQINQARIQKEKNMTSEEKLEREKSVLEFKRRRKALEDYSKSLGNSSSSIYNSRPCILSKKDRRY